MEQAAERDGRIVELEEALAASQRCLAAARAEVERLAQALAAMTHERDEYRKYAELIELDRERLRRYLFGRKSERLSAEEQSRFAFAAVEEDGPANAPVAAPEAPAPQEATGAHARCRSRATGRRTPHGRQRLPAHLPVETIELPPPVVQGEQAAAYVRIGEEVSESLEWRAASYVRVRVVRPKYARKGEPEAGVTIAPVPERPIPRALAGASLLAHVIVSKYCDHLPLYRQSRQAARAGLSLSRSTLCGWIEACHALAVCVVEAMWQDALRCDYLAVDATGVLVQAKGGCRKGHFWVLIAGHDHVLFRYTRRHTSEAVRSLLGDYRGTLQADAATVYDFLYRGNEERPPPCDELGCWAHARRRFFEALTTDARRAAHALEQIGMLYRSDRETAALTGDERTRVRAAQAAPVLDAFFAWADQAWTEVLPESPIGKAIGYARNQRPALRRVFADGRFRLDNNWSERELRREVLGRRNWLFVGSDDGAHWNTTFVSLIASCQLHDIEPWAYLRDLLTLLPHWPRHRVLELAPKLWKQTTQQPEAQRLLEADVLRRISLVGP